MSKAKCQWGYCTHRSSDTLAFYRHGVVASKQNGIAAYATRDFCPEHAKMAASYQPGRWELVP